MKTYAAAASGGGQDGADPIVLRHVSRLRPSFDALRELISRNHIDGRNP